MEGGNNMTKKAKLIIIIIAIAILLKSLAVTYLVLESKGVWQENILARTTHTMSSKGIAYNDNTYVQYYGIWHLDVDNMVDMGGYLWTCYFPWDYYACEMYADNVQKPIFIYSVLGNSWDSTDFVREDFTLPLIWETTCSTIVTKKANLWDSPTYKFHFTDNNGALLKLTPEQIVDASFGFTYSERPEKFIKIGYAMLYWSEYPCLYYSSSIYFDGNDYYMDLLGSPDPLVKENLYYKIKNEQFIEYCKTLYIDG